MEKLKMEKNIRYGKVGDKEKAKKIWKKCFLDSDEEIEFYFENLYKDENLVILEENGVMKSCMHENKYNLIVNRNEIPSFFIVGVGVLPEYRNKGCMDKLIRFSMMGAKENGYDFVYLHPINSEIYSRYGFSYVSDIENYSFYGKDIPFDKIEKSYQIKEIDENNMDEYLEDCIDIYNFKMKSFFMYVQRDREKFRNLFLEVFSDKGEVYIFYEGEIPKGYLILYKSENKIILRELFAKNGKTVKNILGFIKSFKDYYQEINLKAPIREKMNLYFPNQNLIKKESTPYIMGRILNPLAILKKVINLNSVFKIKIIDNVILENTGIYIVKNGEVNFVRDGNCDLEIDIEDFAQLVFGYMEIDELDFLDKIIYKDKEILENFKKKCKFKILKNYFFDYQ